MSDQPPIPSNPPGHEPPPGSVDASDQSAATTPLSDLAGNRAVDVVDLVLGDQPAVVVEPEAVVALPPADPWAHRRGEPRVFAFFWTFYVLLAVAGSLTWVARFTTITAGTYGPAARIMLVVVAVGMVVLWPMTRLSQASPRNHPVVSSLADLLVVQAPVQIVIWPLIVLANWPRDIVIGLASMFATWGVLMGGLVAVGLSGPELRDTREGQLWVRSGWMLFALSLGFGAVVLQWALTALGWPVPAWVLMSSPVTAIPALTGRGLSGPSAPVSRVQWDTIAGTLSLAVLLWSASVARYGLVTRERAD